MSFAAMYVLISPLGIEQNTSVIVIYLVSCIWSYYGTFHWIGELDERGWGVFAVGN